MPRISAFYGIVITMYSHDHAPPHFHASYGEYEAKISIDGGATIAGQLTEHPGNLTLVVEAATRHKATLGSEAGWHAVVRAVDIFMCNDERFFRLGSYWLHRSRTYEFPEARRLAQVYTDR